MLRRSLFFRASIGSVVSHLFFSVRQFFAPEAWVWLDLLESHAHLVFESGSGSAPIHLEIRSDVFVLDDYDCVLRQHFDADDAAAGSADIRGMGKQRPFSGG